MNANQDWQVLPMSSPSPDSQEPLPARMLNEFVYCPRLFYYEHVEGIFQHNADTRRGAALHKRVDSGKGELPPATPAVPLDAGISDSSSTADPVPAADIPEVIHSRSVSLASDRLGVTAKIDLVEVQSGEAINGSVPLSVVPVDYKAGSPREGDDGPEIWDADRMQLGLQCLILRDHGYICTEGVIYYRGTSGFRRARSRRRISPRSSERGPVEASLLRLWGILLSFSPRSSERGPVETKSCGNTVPGSS